MLVTNLFFGQIQFIKSFFGQKFGASPNHFELLYAHGYMTRKNIRMQSKLIKTELNGNATNFCY